GDSKAFSAGADLGGMTFENARDTFWFIRRCHEAFEPIESLPKVVIAAVNGYAFGFGLELTLACDLVVASDRARFGLREMNHGLLPSATVTRGIDVLGRRRVAWLAFTSDDMTADEARDFGLVNKVVPHDELRSTYEELAARTAELGERAQQRIVQFLGRSVEKGELNTAARDAAVARLTVTTDVGDLADCDLVIEAAFEDLEVKQSLFRELEQAVRPDAILATN